MKIDMRYIGKLSHNAFTVFAICDTCLVYISCKFFVINDTITIYSLFLYIPMWSSG